MKTINFFLFSALAFAIANNFHLFSGNVIIPNLLDWAGYGLLIAGVVLINKKNL